MTRTEAEKARLRRQARWILFGVLAVELGPFVVSVIVAAMGGGRKALLFGLFWLVGVAFVTVIARYVFIVIMARRGHHSRSSRMR